MLGRRSSLVTISFFGWEKVVATLFGVYMCLCCIFMGFKPHYLGPRLCEKIEAQILKTTLARLTLHLTMKCCSKVPQSWPCWLRTPQLWGAARWPPASPEPGTLVAFNRIILGYLIDYQSCLWALFYLCISTYSCFSLSIFALSLGAFSEHSVKSSTAGRSELAVWAGILLKG